MAEVKSEHAKSRLLCSAVATLIALSPTTLGACKKHLPEQHPAKSAPKTDSGKSVAVTEPQEWSRGPNLSSLPNEGQFSRPPKEMDYLQPFGRAGFLQPEGDGHGMGLAHFQDTTSGMRVTVSMQGLDPGTYVLRADEYFYGPHEGDKCAQSQKMDSIDQPIVWVLGPLTAGSDGLARLDRVYEGIGNHFGPYRVPEQPIISKKGSSVSINLKVFSLSGRKLTLHKWNAGAQPQLGEPVSCAIIHSARTFGEAAFKPFPGQSIKGTAYFEQGEDNRALLELELSELEAGKYHLVVHEFAAVPSW